MSVLINLGLLCFFKYGTWLLSNVNHVLHKNYSMPFDIILPVGISFYIFQALSYTTDVYRGTIEVERNFFRYALFVSFFHSWLPDRSNAVEICWNNCEKGMTFALRISDMGFSSCYSAILRRL